MNATTTFDSFDSFQEMTVEEMRMAEGGQNPIVKWVGEQIVSWGIGKALDSIWDQASKGGGGGNTHMNSMNAAGDPS